MDSGWIRKPRNGVAVVFIHGILGTEFTWRHENGAVWPLLLCAEPELDDHGVYLFNYRADAFSGTFTIQDAVDNLKERFKLDKVFQQTAIVFVCHSMGGIVARHFVVTQQASFIKTKTKIGFFLVASPSLGSEYANFVSTIAPLYNAHLDILRVGQENPWLATLDRTFMDLKEDRDIPIFGKELIEDNSIFLRRLLRRAQVVEPFAGARYFGDSVKIEHSDHLSIAKPSDRSALQHRLLVQFLEEFFKPETREGGHIAEGSLVPSINPDKASLNPILMKWPETLPIPGKSQSEDEKPKRLFGVVPVYAVLAVFGLILSAILGKMGYDELHPRRMMSLEEYEAALSIKRAQVLSESTGAESGRAVEEKANERLKAELGRVTIATQFWPDGVIPYVIDAAYDNKAGLLEAIKHYQENTNIRFVERTKSNASSLPDYVQFRAGPGCNSFVGRKGGMQQIAAGADCAPGSIIHVLGHALGLYHEQSRPDRDQYVKIVWKNIVPGTEHNFNIVESPVNMRRPYDYSSIMHDPPNAFSENGSPTITPLLPNVSIGQRDRLSPGDVLLLNSLYPKAGRGS
jgi:pimeloyl-ACP methyl ester carboxylesterase